MNVFSFRNFLSCASVIFLLLFATTRAKADDDPSQVICLGVWNSDDSGHPYSLDGDTVYIRSSTFADIYADFRLVTPDNPPVRIESLLWAGNYNWELVDPDDYTDIDTPNADTTTLFADARTPAFGLYTQQSYTLSCSAQGYDHGNDWRTFSDSIGINLKFSHVALDYVEFFIVDPYAHNWHDWDGFHFYVQMDAVGEGLDDMEYKQMVRAQTSIEDFTGAMLGHSDILALYPDPTDPVVIDSEFGEYGVDSRFDWQPIETVVGGTYGWHWDEQWLDAPDNIGHTKAMLTATTRDFVLYFRDANTHEDLGGYPWSFQWDNDPGDDGFNASEPGHNPSDNFSGLY